MKLCLGTVQLGIDYGIQHNGRPVGSEADGILLDALESGITIMDTAEAYGEAETVLGEFIQDYPEKTKSLRIVTKLAPDAFTQYDPKDWAKIACTHARGSLSRLHIEQLEGYLFHNAAYIFNQHAVEAINAVREEGLTKSVGVSIYTPEEAMKALSYDCINVIQVPYNVLDRRLDHCGFFLEAKKRGVKVFARSSLLQGLLPMPLEELPAHMSFAKETLERFHSVCNHFEITPLDVAVGYVMKHPGIDYVVFGVDSRTHLASYTAMQNTQLEETLLAALEDVAKDVPPRLVNPSKWVVKE